MTEIIDIVSQIGIPFACFFAMFYLCDKTLSGVTEAINELSNIVSELKTMINDKKSGEG